MRRVRGCLMVAFIFACGFLVGSFLGAAMGWIGFFHKIAKGGPGAIREIVIERAANDLKLKPDQRAEIRKIVEETGAELASASEEVQPEVEAIIDRSGARIREVLDERQRRKFDRFVNEGRRRWRSAVEARATPPPKPAGDVERATPAPGVQ